MQWWLCIVLSSLIYCELLGDYVKLMQCSWPTVDAEKEGEEELHALILADVHLLGPLRGHPLDKLYREWHMRRAFQASTALFRPDVVFVLGDLFDEGEDVSNAEFRKYVQRFRRYFNTAADVPIISAVGNHDVGFHYKMEPYSIKRFEQQFNNTGVSLYTLKEVHFVLVNSMALEGDGCDLCEAAKADLRQIAGKFKCLRDKQHCDDIATLSAHKSYSRPILLQHFPTYRISDKVCEQTDAPEVVRNREKWDVLSKEATDLLGKLLHPRLAFSGHSHHYCLCVNRLGIEEYTVASYNWRNKLNPSFLLASFTPTQYKVNKCDMLHQDTVYTTYCVTGAVCAVLLLWRIYQTSEQYIRSKKKAL